MRTEETVIAFQSDQGILVDGSGPRDLKCSAAGSILRGNVEPNLAIICIPALSAHSPQPMQVSDQYCTSLSQWH